MFNIKKYNEINKFLKKTSNSTKIVVISKNHPVESILEANSFIFCAPEYNGGVPPVLSNALTWISVQTKDWREAFNNKIALVATHSGGDGFRFLTAFRIQLEYLGVTVYSRSITVSNSKPYDEDKVKKILANYLELIK